MAKFSRVTHVIFDLDGTILDTERIYTEIYIIILNKFGKHYTNEVRLALTGTKELVSSQIIVDMLQVPITPEEFNEQVKNFSQNLLSDPALKPGAERLIRHLHRFNIPIAIATSSSLESFQLKTAKHEELFSLFHHIVSGSTDQEVVEGKPAPDIFLVAAKRFDDTPSPHDCLVFEDAPHGVHGAKAAGMQVVMIPEEYCPMESTQEATIVLSSFDEFVPEMFGLPAYPKK